MQCEVVHNKVGETEFYTLNYFDSIQVFDQDGYDTGTNRRAQLYCIADVPAYMMADTATHIVESLIDFLGIHDAWDGMTENECTVLTWAELNLLLAEAATQILRGVILASITTTPN